MSRFGFSRATNPVVSLLTVLILGSTCQAADFFVATDGDDRAQGSFSAPFATLARARDAARARLRSGHCRDPIEIVIRQGVHRLRETLVMTPDDSGTTLAPIVYRAAAGERPVISGGEELVGSWTHVASDVWRLDLDSRRVFYDLFVDGHRATRARTPNTDDSMPVLLATGGTRDRIVLPRGIVRAGWGDAAGAFVHVVPSLRFFNQINDIRGVDVPNQTILLGTTERHRDVDTGSWLFLEGLREWLDQPGEWWLDPAGSQLFYVAHRNEHPPSECFTTPRLDALVHLCGDIIAGSLVEHIHFRGLCFEQTARTFGHVEPRTQPAASFRLTNARHCSVSDCLFHNLGDYGIWLHLDSCDNMIAGNEIVDAGAGGVLLTSARLGYMDDRTVLSPAAASGDSAPLRNVIRRNHIHHCGLHRYYCSGIHLDSRPAATAFAAGNYVGHNHIHHMPRNGIFAFRNQGGTVIEGNLIEHTMLETQDGGGIHVATMNPLAAPVLIVNNVVSHCWGWCWAAEGRRERRIARGIYLDWCTSSATIRDNVVFDTSDGGLAFLGGDDNQFINNIVIGDDTLWDPAFLGGVSRRIVDQSNVVIPDSAGTLPVRDPAAGDFAPNPAFACPPGFVAIDTSQVGLNGTGDRASSLSSLARPGSIIPHDSPEGISTTGSWETTSTAGLWNLFETRFRRSVGGAPATIRFSLPIEQDGLHDVRILFPASVSHASRGQAIVAHADGVDTLTIDQRTFGLWPSLGHFRFVTGRPATVTLIAAADDGPLAIEAVGVVRIAPCSAPETR